MLFKVAAVCWCCKENLKIVVKLLVLHWLKFAVQFQAQDSDSHILVIKKKNQAGGDGCRICEGLMRLRSL